MSSSTPKKNRACDSCRRKKARCNGFGIPGGRCATCVTHSVECTYKDPPLARNPRRLDQPPSHKVTSKIYVKTLETRLSNLERLIERYDSNSISPALPSSPRGRLVINDSESEEDAEPRQKSGPLPPPYSQLPDPDSLPPLPGAFYSGDELSTYPEKDLNEVSDKVQNKARFLGESGMFMFTNRVFGGEAHKHDPLRSMQTRRTEFWEPPDWFTLIPKSPVVQFEFPEMDLMAHLVDCYFDNLDVILPLLHRPSFVRSIAEGFHEADQNFGAIVLLVCAIGCRYASDSRVAHELSTSAPCTAWSLYNQVNKIRKLPYLPHSLHEVQIYPLSALFLDAYSPAVTPWLIIGTGLRIMQDSGVHRKFFSRKGSLEKELWKRAFWVLVVLDRAFSTLLGRPCVLQDEDFDADLPLICNDEDLDDSGLISLTETNPPTRMCCFVAAIKLNQILALALRTIYSTRKSRVILGYVGERWERHIVDTLDSALGEWVDAVPERLRWGSEAPNKSREELIQSVFLWTQFYEIQLHIHRMFALKEPPNPELSVPSMGICKNASNQCITIIESARDVMMVPLHSFLLIKSLFTSTVFLLLMFWKKKGIDYSSPEFRAIEAGTEMVEQTAKRRRSSLHLLDIARILRGAVDGSYTRWKINLRDLTRIKFEEVRYVDQDGILTDEGQGRWAESGMDYASTSVPSPPVTTRTMWCYDQEPTATQTIDSEGVPTGNHHPDQPAEFPPAELFADPSVFFFGPSSAGPDETDNQQIARDVITCFGNLYAGRW